MDAEVVAWSWHTWVWSQHCFWNDATNAQACKVKGLTGLRLLHSRLMLLWLIDKFFWGDMFYWSLNIPSKMAIGFLKKTSNLSDDFLLVIKSMCFPHSWDVFQLFYRKRVKKKCRWTCVFWLFQNPIKNAPNYGENDKVKTVVFFGTSLILYT